MNRLSTLVICLVCTFALGTSLAQGQEELSGLTKAKREYAVDLEKTIKPVNERYLPKLEELKKQLIFKGDIRGALVVEEVTQKMTSGEPVGRGGSNEPYELQEIRKNYDAEMQAALSPVTSLHIAKLEVLKQQLAMAGNLRGALAIEPEIENAKSSRSIAEGNGRNVIFRDDFRSSAFKNEWKWIRKGSDVWKLQNNQLLVTTSGYKYPHQASFLYVDEPTGDYVVETHVVGNPIEDCQQAGLIIYNADGNMLRLTAAYSAKYVTGGISLWWGKILDGKWTTESFIPLRSIDTKIRIEKRSGNYTPSYFNDELKQWDVMGGSVNAPFFDNKIALSAHESGPPITFAFKYFDISEIR